MNIKMWLFKTPSTKTNTKSWGLASKNNKGKKKGKPKSHKNEAFVNKDKARRERRGRKHTWKMETCKDNGKLSKNMLEVKRRAL